MECKKRKMQIEHMINTGALNQDDYVAKLGAQKEKDMKMLAYFK